MGRFSRRWPLIIGGVWQSIWLFVFAGAGVGGDATEKKWGTLMIVSAALFIFSYASTWAPGMWGWKSAVVIPIADCFVVL